MSENEGVSQNNNGLGNKEKPVFHWRDKTTLSEINGIKKAFVEVLDLAEQRLNFFNREKIEEDRIAVVISAYDAKDLLPETIKHLVNQIKFANLQGEIFIIFNNGGGNTCEFIRDKISKEELERKKKELGLDDIIFGNTKPLQKKEEENDLRVVPRELQLAGNIEEKSGVRLVVINQLEEPENAGKIRALRDIYNFLILLNKKTGYYPRYLLAADAETRLICNDKELDQNFGLGHMISVSSNGEKMVGAKLNFVPYDNNGNPNFSEKIPPMQMTTNLMHGGNGFEWLPGGATLGDFSYMVAILSTISERLPGTRIEDVLTTVIAKAFGIETLIDEKVIHTNRCPNIKDKEAVFEQMLRWLKGAEGLRRLVGKSLAQKVIDNNLIEIIKKSLKKRKEVDIIYLLTGLIPYLRIILLSSAKPDDFKNGSPTFG